ncbi:MAG: hypothetical protein PHD06_02010 [Bacteroidales bacterium]|jgi:hypothetical protein|nr:hypothetical protein [Bacteroidales bacterium]MDY0196340.1 hypothetical protein [Tenuifilaceae bacterium]
MKNFLAFIYLFAFVIICQACGKSCSSDIAGKEELRDSLSLEHYFGLKFNRNVHTLKPNSLDSIMLIKHDASIDSSNESTPIRRPYNVILQDGNQEGYSKTQFTPYHDQKGDSNIEKPYVFLQYRY